MVLAPRPKKDGWYILFDRKEKVSVEAEAEDNNPNVISTNVGNNIVRRILIDDESTIKVLS